MKTINNVLLLITLMAFNFCAPTEYKAPIKIHYPPLNTYHAQRGFEIDKTNGKATEKEAFIYINFKHYSQLTYNPQAPLTLVRKTIEALKAAGYTSIYEDRTIELTQSEFEHCTTEYLKNPKQCVGIHLSLTHDETSNRIYGSLNPYHPTEHQESSCTCKEILFEYDPHSNTVFKLREYNKGCILKHYPLIQFGFLSHDTGVCFISNRRIIGYHGPTTVAFIK